jgi:hypothetical protein
VGQISHKRGKTPPLVLRLGISEAFPSPLPPGYDLVLLDDEDGTGSSGSVGPDFQDVREAAEPSNRRRNGHLSFGGLFAQDLNIASDFLEIQVFWGGASR